MKKNHFGLQAAMIMLSMILFACNNNNGNAVDGSADTTIGDKAENAIDTAAKRISDRWDENFVVNAIEDNAEEIRQLRAGSSFGTDAEVKSSAQQMIADHEQIDRDLRAYAVSHNMDIGDADTETIVDVSSNDKPGKAWDEEWADEAGDMHRITIRKFERNQNRTKDTELKELINKILPTLHDHLSMAEKLEGRLDK